MRYTTVIDISEMQDIYRNHNCRLVYLHLALKSGYHDDDRDRIKTSIRILAGTVGISVSAVRHALAQLEKAQLVKRDGDYLVVKKWIIDAAPTPRNIIAKAKKSGVPNTMYDDFQKQIQEFQQRVYEAVRDMSKSELQEKLSELMEGRSTRLRRVTLKSTEQNIRWLNSVIEKL